MSRLPGHEGACLRDRIEGLADLLQAHLQPCPCVPALTNNGRLHIVSSRGDAGGTGHGPRDAVEVTCLEHTDPRQAPPEQRGPIDVPEQAIDPRLQPGNGRDVRSLQEFAVQRGSAVMQPVQPKQGHERGEPGEVAGRSLPA